MSCFAYGCNHRAPREGCRFFRFPKDRNTFNVWRDMCRRNDSEPSLATSRLCSCHFKDMLKVNGPTIFPWTEGGIEFSNPEIRIKTELPETRPIKKENEAQPESIKIVSSMSVNWSSGITGAENLTIITPSKQAIEQYSHISSSTKRNLTQKDVAALKNEIELLRSELALLKATPRKNEPGNILYYNSIKENSRLLQYYTGLPNKDIFEILLKSLNVPSLKYHEGWTVLKLTPENQLLLTLVKLRLNFDFTDLSVRFQISSCGVRNIFFTYIHALHENMFPYIRMPSSVKNECTSSEFDNVSNCRCIVDCMEIYFEAPKSKLNDQSQMFSKKSRNMFKGIIACSTQGTITFVSKLYPGSVSVNDIYKKCGITDLLVQGDLVLMDKNFSANEIVPPSNSENNPNQLGQITEEAKTYNEVAKSHSNIKRIIGQMRRYNILDFLPTHLRQFESVIFQVIACLVNCIIVNTEEQIDSVIDISDSD